MERLGISKQSVWMRMMKEDIVHDANIFKKKVFFAINEKANEVRILLGAAKQQYDIFGNLIRKARKKIDEAGKTLDDADKRNNIILKKLGKAELIDGAEAGDIPGLTGPAETEIKEED